MPLGLLEILSRVPLIKVLVEGGDGLLSLVIFRC